MRSTSPMLPGKPAFTRLKDDHRTSPVSQGGQSDPFGLAIWVVRRQRHRAQNEKLTWTEGYKRSHRELQLRFLDNPKRVERFFRPVRRAGRADRGPHVVPVVPTPSVGATA